jgi:TonB family protein
MQACMGIFLYNNMKSKCSIITISMMISASLHIIVILILVLTFTQNENRSYKLWAELIHSYNPFYDNQNKTLNNKATTWNKNAKNKMSEPSKETSNNTVTGSPQDKSDKAMRLYEALILKKIYAAKYYPEHSQLRKEEGTVTVRFKLLPDGTLSGRPKIVKSCNYLQLNRAALNTIISAAPFPKFDENIIATEMTFTVTLEYLL